MSTWVAIVIGGVAMSAVALLGLVTVVLPTKVFNRLVLPMVALAAGSLVGGALFHMLPTAVDLVGAGPETFGLVALGIVTFLVLEQLLHWHHCHRNVAGHDALHVQGSSVACGPSGHSAHGGGQRPHPVGVLVLVADGLHNFLGGLAVGGAFVVDLRLGVVAWIVAAAHEIPQELGDFGLLVHSGWSRTRAWSPTTVRPSSWATRAPT